MTVNSETFYFYQILCNSTISNGEIVTKKMTSYLSQLSKIQGRASNLYKLINNIKSLIQLSYELNLIYIKC